jgi:hypothetical protein
MGGYLYLLKSVMGTSARSFCTRAPWLDDYVPQGIGTQSRYLPFPRDLVGYLHQISSVKPTQLS